MYSEGLIFRHKTKPCFHIYFGNWVVFYIGNVTHSNEQTSEFITISKFDR